MEHPNSKDVRKVVELFKSVLPMATRNEQLKMSCTYVREEPCGTVACHGGWFGIAAKLDMHEQGWTAGADKIAEFLGFDGWWALNIWAATNPKIWGATVRGNHIFSNVGHLCFYHPERRPNGAENLQHIVDHWSEVADRLEALERSQVPELSSPPVYVEDLINEGVQA